VNRLSSSTRLRHAPALVLALVLALVFVLVPANPALAATITVPAGDAAALIAAINSANASAGADTIELAGGTYTLTQQRTPCGDPAGLPVITSAITINGNGATIQRDPALNTDPSPLRFRVMALASGADVTLNNLTIANGRATFRSNPNGGIKGRHPNKPGSNIGQIGGARQNGSAPLERARVRGQVPADAVCEIQSNVSGRPSTGANILVSSGATLVINNVTIRDGNATSGGGITNGGTLTVNDSTWSNNNAIFDGGALLNANGATAVVNRSSASGSATGQSGGAFWNQGTLTLNETDVRANQSRGGGGGIVNDFTGTLHVNNSTVRDNVANYLGLPDDTGSGGGGIANFRGIVTISGSTIAGNDTGYAEGGGGGIGNFGGTMTIVNSTIHDNTAVQNGGGVYVGLDPAYPDLPNGTLTIRSSTITGNEVESFSRRRDNNFPPVFLEFISAGGGVYAASGATATIHNSIIAGNATLPSNGDPVVPASTAVDVAGTFSGGYNLLGDATGSTGFAGNGNLAGTSTAPIDPRLGPLDANGGATVTRLPLAGSPALTAGNPADPGTTTDVCPAADQRGVSRAGKPCDIGSVQVSTPDTTPPTVTVAAPNAPAGQGGFFNAADGPVTVSVSANDASGVSSISCTVNGSPVVVSGQSGTRPRTGSFALSGSGTYTIACSATDVRGNSGAASGSANTATVKIDADAPTISSAIAPASPAPSGWYNSSTGAPTVSFTCDDTGGSGLAGACPASVILNEGADQSVSHTVTDVAGNSSAAATRTGINVDLTAPTLAPVVAPNPVLLNGSATATPNAGDALSGLAHASCGALVVNSVGAKSVSCSATDRAGNSASASTNYNVVFQFSGFRPPVDNPPTVNVANAGRNLPLKFRITDANGEPIANLTSVRLAAPVFACSTGAPSDVIEEYVEIDSGLRYLGNGEYQYNWKTPKSYAGTCRTLKLDLGEGTGLERTALFQFR
jgi:hypothetical protein